MDNNKNFLTWLRADSTRADDVDKDYEPCNCICESGACDTPFCRDDKKPKRRAPKYENLTDEDIAYIEAVRRGQESVYGPMIKLAFMKACPDTVVKDEVWRRDNSCEFTEFKVNRKKKTDAGWLGEGVSFFGAREEAQAAYQYGWNLRPFFVNVKRPYSIDKPTHDAIARANARKTSHEVTEITSDFDGVFYNGEMREEWCVRDPKNVKAAWATRDDDGNIIPLSYRFKLDDPDFRF